MSYSCRLADAGDLNFCVGYDESPRVNAESLKRMMLEGRIYLALAPDGRRVAYARLDYLNQRYPLVGNLNVYKDFRSQGAGEALLAFVEKAQKEAGQKLLLALSLAYEEAPQDWMARQGWWPCGKIEDLNGDGRAEIIYRKDLL